MLPGLPLVRGSAGEDPKTALPPAQVSAKPGAVQALSVPVSGTASSDLIEAGGDNSSSSARSHCPDPVYEPKVPSPRRGSRSVLHPKHRVRAQHPYPTRKSSRLAQRDSSPLRPLQVRIALATRTCILVIT